MAKKAAEKKIQDSTPPQPKEAENGKIDKKSAFTKVSKKQAEEQKIVKNNKQKKKNESESDEESDFAEEQSILVKKAVKKKVVAGQKEVAVDKKSKAIKKSPTKEESKAKVEPKKPIKAANKKAQEEDDSMDEEGDFDMPGQIRQTPDDNDPLRIFYESLYNVRPTSQMAEKYCLEYGLLAGNKAQEVWDRIKKKVNKKQK